MLLAGAFVFCGNVQDTVGVEVEGNFDLRDTTRSRSDTVENEATERLVVGGEFALALEDVNFDLRLIVSCGAESFGLRRRNSGVAVDERSAYTAHGFDTEGKRGDVEKEDIFNVALEHATLNRSADSDDFVGVDALHWVFAENRFDLFDHGRHASHTTDHDDFVDVFGRELGVF